MRIHQLIAAVLSAAALAGCGEKTAQEITTPVSTGAGVRFYNFGVNAPGVNFYANDKKVTAITSSTGAESTTGTGFGALGNGGNYSVLAAGAYTFTGKIAATTDKDLSISPVSMTIVDGKAYSYYMSGIYDATAKKVDAFIIEDALPSIDYSQASIRFVNAISNSQPMTLYAKNTTTGVETAIGSTVAYKSAGAFAALVPGIYDLSTRVAGSSTNVITRAGVGFAGGHVYTISSKGDINATTGTTARALDNTANK